MIDYSWTQELGCMLPYRTFRKPKVFVQISNGWASRFKILFEIRTICNPTSFWLFKIQTSPISDPLCRYKILNFTILNNKLAKKIHFRSCLLFKPWLENRLAGQVKVNKLDVSIIINVLYSDPHSFQILDHWTVGFWVLWLLSGFVKDGTRYLLWQGVPALCLLKG